LAGISLVIQIISGVLLTMYYTSNLDLAFVSLEYIVRHVNLGWLLRFIHSNGASVFIIY
jgi:ubiquinol-cytochrome c reductase cytochrome b subunit